jgi:hypothetical protein
MKRRCMSAPSRTNYLSKSCALVKGRYVDAFEDLKACRQQCRNLIDDGELKRPCEPDDVSSLLSDAFPVEVQIVDIVPVLPGSCP